MEEDDDLKTMKFWSHQERLMQIECKQKQFKADLDSIELNSVLQKQIKSVLVDLQQQQQQQQQHMVAMNGNDDHDDDTTDDDDHDDGADDDLYHNYDVDYDDYDDNERLVYGNHGTNVSVDVDVNSIQSMYQQPSTDQIQSDHHIQHRSSAKFAKRVENANKTSDWYWSMHRLYLGTEWSRIKLKLNSIKANYKKSTQLLRKYERFKQENRMEKLVSNVAPSTMVSPMVHEDVDVDVDSMDGCNVFISPHCDYDNGPIANEDETDDIDEAVVLHHADTSNASRCTQTKPANLLNRRLIRFDRILRPYVNMLNYINENQYEDKLCKCDMNTKSCIICHMDKQHLREHYNKYSSDLVESIYSEHSYCKMYVPSTTMTAIVSEYQVPSNLLLCTTSMNQTMTNNDTCNCDSNGNADLSKGCSIIVSQYDCYQLTQTPPPTPQQAVNTSSCGSSSSNSVSVDSTPGTCADAVNDEADSSLLLMPNNNNSQSHSSHFKSSNLNSYNLYMSSNKYYMNLFETSFKNYKNNLIVDAGNEMDPNDMHKLPNIYDELRFYNSQNDENMLNGIISKQMDRKQLKRKWNSVYNSYHGSVNDMTMQTKIKRKYAFYNSTGMHKRRMKRRSASSSSSNSSFNSNLTMSSIHVDNLPSNTTNCMILNDASNKFDIDNIVIPYDMLCGSSANMSKLVFVARQEIQTPLWRENDVDDEQVLLDDLDRIEELSDDFYRKLHEFNELKERYYTVFKKLEKEKIKQQQRREQQQQQQQQGTNDPALHETNTTAARERLSNLCLDEFKNLVNKLENEHNKRRINGQHKTFMCQQQNNSLLMFKCDSHMVKNILPWPKRQFPLNGNDETALSVYDQHEDGLTGF